MSFTRGAVCFARCAWAVAAVVVVCGRNPICVVFVLAIVCRVMSWIFFRQGSKAKVLNGMVLFQSSAKVLLIVWNAAWQNLLTLLPGIFAESGRLNFMGANEVHIASKKATHASLACCFTCRIKEESLLQVCVGAANPCVAVNIVCRVSC